MIKLAIPTNDRLTLARQTGRADEFAIYTLNQELAIEYIDYKKNTHNHDHNHHDHDHDHHDHGAGHNHDDLAELLVGCTAVLVQHAGPHFKVSMEKSGISIVFVESQTLEGAVNEYKNIK